MSCQGKQTPELDCWSINRVLNGSRTEELKSDSIEANASTPGAVSSLAFRQQLSPGAALSLPLSHCSPSNKEWRRLDVCRVVFALSPGWCSVQRAACSVQRAVPSALICVTDKRVALASVMHWEGLGTVASTGSTGPEPLGSPQETV